MKYIPSIPFFAGWVGLLAVGCKTETATAQTKTLRIVTYNIEDDINGATIPLPGLIAPPGSTNVMLGGVLEGIGEENVGGDTAQPVDVLALEETTSNPVTVAPIVNGLNAFYNSPGMYAMSPYQATESGGDNADGNGPNAVVYNTKTLQLLASVPVDPVGGIATLGTNSGDYREVMRYEFAPAGATSTTANEFYVYVSHYKASTGTVNENYRNGEAQIIRTNEARDLPASARVLYVGDYNVTSSAEPSYQTILAASAPNGVTQGQGFDPLNPSAATNINWGTITTNQTILAMETESAMDLRFRDDLELMTSNVYYGVPGGLSLVPGTYHVFGNNGTTRYNGTVNSGSNTALNTDLISNPTITAAQLYIDLTNASDHLPVVADYTIPVPAVPVALGNFHWSREAGFQFTVSNADGTPITAAEQADIAIYVTTDSTLSLSNWTMLTDAGTLAGGVLKVIDTNGATLPQRFYRAVRVFQAP